MEIDKEICIINSSHNIYGGGQIFADEVRKELLRNGINCKIFASDRVLDNVVQIEKLDTWSNKFKNINKIIAKLPKDRSKTVIILNDITISMFSFYFKMRGYKVVSLIHMSIFNTVSNNKLVLKYYPLIRAFLINKGSHLILNVNKENEKLMECEYVGNFISQEISKKSPPNILERQYDYLYVGRFSEEKNPIGFVKIIKELIKVKPNLKAVMVGDGVLLDDISNFIKLNGLGDSISVIGFLPREQISRYYENSKLLVIPSITEGLPTTILEAACFYTPFIATPVGSIPWITENYKIGAISKFDNMVDALSNEMRYNKSDFDKFIKDHNVNTFTERMINLIKGC
ncbi:glycosyltransferase family 4 protein [Vibrio breoganii]